MAPSSFFAPAWRLAATQAVYIWLLRKRTGIAYISGQRNGIVGEDALSMAFHFRRRRGA